MLSFMVQNSPLRHSSRLFSLRQILSIGMALSTLASAYEPSYGLGFDAKGADAASLSKSIRIKKPSYDPAQLETILAEVEASNQRMERRLVELDQTLMELRNEKQDWLREKDAVQQLVRLDSLRKVGAQIREETRRKLAEVAYSGIYLTVQPVADEYTALEALDKAAEQAIAPRATADLNGLFLQSSTTIRDNVVWQDIIRAQISGAMTVEKSLIRQHLIRSKRFVYLARVQVRPLGAGSSLKDADLEKTSVQGSIVLSPRSLAGLDSALQRLGIGTKELAGLPTDDAFQECAARNRVADLKKADILQRDQRRLLLVEADLLKIELDLVAVKKRLAGQGMMGTDLAGEIRKKLGNIDAQILQALKGKLEVKSEELVVRKDAVVESQGDPAEDVARTALGILNQQTQSFGTVSNFFEESVVENFMEIGFRQNQGRDIYREQEKSWLFPVPQNDGTRKLTLVTKLRVTDKTTSAPAKRDVVKGTFTDMRDGQSYGWVKIGSQVWMAQNLNYAPKYQSSWCFGDKPENCAKYGSLYDWKTAGDVCPTGWHLPSDADWIGLEKFIGDSAKAGELLKAAQGWDVQKNGQSGNGTDAFGFNALPGGGRSKDFGFARAGSNAYFWSSSENDAQGVWYRRLDVGNETLNRNNSSKAIGFSVRCLKDGL